MNSEIKQKMDELSELRRQNYISGEEYTTARENLLLDAGFDIIPRVENTLYSRPAMRRERRGMGCGCFLMVILLAFAAAGGLLAMPEEKLRGIPFIGQLADREEYREIRQALLYFIDDLQGNPAHEGASLPATPPTPALPQPLAEPSPELRSDDTTMSRDLEPEPVPDTPASSDTSQAVSEDTN